MGFRTEIVTLAAIGTQRAERCIPKPDRGFSEPTKRGRTPPLGIRRASERVARGLKAPWDLH